MVTVLDIMKIIEKDLPNKYGDFFDGFGIDANTVDWLVNLSSFKVNDKKFTLAEDYVEQYSHYLADEKIFWCIINDFSSYAIKLHNERDPLTKLLMYGALKAVARAESDIKKQYLEEVIVRDEEVVYGYKGFLYNN